MKILNSREFFMFLCELQEVHDNCEESRRLIAFGKLPKVTIGNAVDESKKVWERAAKICRELRFESAHDIAGLALIHLAHAPLEADFSYLCVNNRTLINQIIGDAWKRKFIEVPAEYSDYVNNDAILGNDINLAFRSAAPELREAGNCMACDCNTAAVFHLMRAVECGLRAFCKHLNIKSIPKSKKPGNKKYIPIEYSQWEKILQEVHEKVDEKINKLSPSPPKQEAQEFYFSLLQEVTGFKGAWRNHVMHSRAIYTDKDAKAILDHVRRFLTLLSTKVTE